MPAHHPVLQVNSLSPPIGELNAPVRVPTNVCTVTVAFTTTATDRCQTGEVRDTAAATCPVNTPAITVTHECPTESLLRESLPPAGNVRNAATSP
jgi:hypothetical protein